MLFFGFHKKWRGILLLLVLLALSNYSSTLVSYASLHVILFIGYLWIGLCSDSLILFLILYKIAGIVHNDLIPLVTVVYLQLRIPVLMYQQQQKISRV
jgi:hypothetical protein